MERGTRTSVSRRIRACGLVKGRSLHGLRVEHVKRMHHREEPPLCRGYAEHLDGMPRPRLRGVSCRDEVLQADEQPGRAK